MQPVQPRLFPADAVPEVADHFAARVQKGQDQRFCQQVGTNGKHVKVTVTFLLFFPVFRKHLGDGQDILFGIS